MNFDITAKIQELIALGVEPNLAATVAGSMLATLQQEVTAAQEVARKTAEQSAGIRDWNGLKLVLAEDKPMPSAGYTLCKSNGVAVSPANVGIGSSGEKTLFPPMMWIAADGHKILRLTLLEMSILAKAVKAIGGEQFATFLQEKAGPDAVKAYEAERSAKEASGEISKQGNKRPKAKA
jgi:hypothetical protein